MSPPIVLLVDDEPGLLVLFSRLLEQLGYAVLQADGGAGALDILQQTAPDLLILDLAMPLVPGIEVLRAVRSEPRLARMKVMILTARTANREVEALGIDSWIAKPIMPVAFMDAVRQLME